MSFDAFFGSIVSLLESETASLRSKSLKCLQEIVIVDTTCLEREQIRTLLSDRLLDTSTNVRDAAIDLLGRIIGSAGSMEQSVVRLYYPMLANRILVYVDFCLIFCQRISE